MIANLEQYEIADTTISIKQNNQSINIRLKANFGVLEIKPAYSDGIGKNERWSLAINGKTYYSLKNRLDPGRYNVELNHECYEALSFEAGINRDKREVFNMASHIKLKMGGLALRAEQDGEPVSEPVFVNGEQVDETPFSGSVPICADIEVGNSREKVNVELKHNDNVAYTHKMPDSEERLSRMKVERKKKQDEEAKQTAWMKGLTIGGGASFNMNKVDPNYFKSLGKQFNINIEFYKRNNRFFRLGLNLDMGEIDIDKDITRRMLNIPDDAEISASHLKLNAFAKLYPVNFLFLSGGAGNGVYEVVNGKTAEVKTSTLILPLGGGICLCSSVDNDFGGGVVIEGLYNIVPFKGRIATYISVNAGIRISWEW
jgi:hypothetical protein